MEPAFALLTPGERAEFRISVHVDRLVARVRAARGVLSKKHQIQRIDSGQRISFCGLDLVFTQKKGVKHSLFVDRVIFTMKKEEEK